MLYLKIWSFLQFQVFYAVLQVKNFIKWNKSNCIIEDLIKIYFQNALLFLIKEFRTLYRKVKKYNCVKYDDIKVYFWNSFSKFQSIKGQNYDNAIFANNETIII